MDRNERANTFCQCLHSSVCAKGTEPPPSSVSTISILLPFWPYFFHKRDFQDYLHLFFFSMSTFALWLVKLRLKHYSTIYIRNLKPTKFEPLWLWPSFIDPQRCICYLMPSECVHCSAWKSQLSPSHLLLSSSKSVLWPFGLLRIRHHLILMLWFAGFVCVCLLMLMSVSVLTNKQGMITAVFLWCSLE